MLLGLALALATVLVLAVGVIASGVHVVLKLVAAGLLLGVAFVLAWAIALVFALRTEGPALDDSAAALDEDDDLEPRDYGA